MKASELKNGDVFTVDPYTDLVYTVQNADVCEHGMRRNDVELTVSTPRQNTEYLLWLKPGQGVTLREQ